MAAGIKEGLEYNQTSSENNANETNGHTNIVLFLLLVVMVVVVLGREKGRYFAREKAAILPVLLRVLILQMLHRLHHLRHLHQLSWCKARLARLANIGPLFPTHCSSRRRSSSSSFDGLCTYHPPVIRDFVFLS